MSQTPASQPRFTVLARPAISSSASPPTEETTSPAPADSQSSPDTKDQSTTSEQSIADDKAKQDLTKSPDSAASEAKGTAKPAIIAKKVIDPWTVDDWETAADRDPSTSAEPRPEEVNKKLWETANQVESFEILPANTPQPITLYKPEVKILKRTASATPPPSARKESSQTAAESLKERERRYKEVREKIFGPSADSEGQESSNSRSGSPGPNEGSGDSRSSNNNNNNNNQKNNGGKKKNKRREKDADAEANSQLPPISVPIRAPKGPDSLGFGFGRGGGSGGRGGRGGRGAAPTRGLNDGTVAAIATPVSQDPIDYITRADPTGGRGGYMMGQHGQMMQGNMMGVGYGFPQQQQQPMGAGSSNYANHLLQGQAPQMGHGQNRMMSPGLGMPVNQGIQSPTVQQLWNSAAGQGYPQQQINTTMYPMHGMPSSRSPLGATGVSGVPNQWNSSNPPTRGLGPQGNNPSLSSQAGQVNPQAMPHSQAIPSNNPWGQPQQQQSQLQQPQHYIPSQQQQPTYAQQATQKPYPQYGNPLYSSQLQQSQPQSQQTQQQTSAWGPIGRNIPPQAIPTAALGRGLPSSNSSRSGVSGVGSPGQGNEGLVGEMGKLRLWEPGR